MNAAPSVSAPSDQTYTSGTAISSLSFNEASDGTSPFSYKLSSNLPGGPTFDGNTRKLTGTPAAATSDAVTVT